MAAPLPKDEEARLAALREFHILDTPGEDSYDDITRLAAFICGTPIASVTLIDAERQWFKSALGLLVSETPRDTAFCAYTILQPDLMVVPDATEDARFADNPLVTGGPRIRFYAGMPLVTEDGHALGSLCVIDRTPRHLTADQESALRTLARHVVRQMERARRVALQERLIAEWERAEEQRQTSADALRQFEAAVASAEEGIVIADARRHDLPLTYVNPAFLALTGYTEHEILGRNCRFLQGANTDPNAKRHIHDCLDAGQSCRVTLLNYKKNGAAFWNELTIAPIRDDAGTLSHFVGIQHDITERVEQDRQVRDANRVLEAQKAQLEAANAVLAALATTDPLTGLLNHHAFYSRLQEEARRVQSGGVAAVALLDLNDFHFFNDTYGHAAGDVVLQQVAARLKEVCGAGDAVAHFGGDEFTVLLPGSDPATTPLAVEARLRAGLSGVSYQPDGAATAIPITVSVGAALLRQNDGGDDGPAGALRLAEERLRRAKTGGDAETEADRVRAQAGRSLSGFTMLDALVTAVDNKDRYTRKHSEDVMEYSLAIARELGIDEATRDTVSVAALLHDVGKIGVPDAILRKPGKLTDEEFEAVKQHPQMGAVMVGAVPGLEKTLDAVRHHHERWDGDGYPFGLKGEETPLMARLMAVADAFSAMTTNRPYRRGMDREVALRVLDEGSGTQWDPECVRAFLRATSAPRHPQPRPQVDAGND